MIKLASVALTILGVGGIACATSANADPYLRAEVVLPRVVVEPFAFVPGYYSRYYAHAPYGYGYRGYDHGRYEHYRRAYDWHRR